MTVFRYRINKFKTVAGLRRSLNCNNKYYPPARFTCSRYSDLMATYSNLWACYRGRNRITVSLASAVIMAKNHIKSCILLKLRIRRKMLLSLMNISSTQFKPQSTAAHYICQPMTNHSNLAINNLSSLCHFKFALQTQSNLCQRPLDFPKVTL